MQIIMSRFMNCSVITVMLASLLLASVPNLAKGHSNKANITCQSEGNLCPGEGSYKCCDKLVCGPQIVGGASVCLRQQLGIEGKPDNNGCREKGEACITYGEYQCCGDMSCVPTTPLNQEGVCLPAGEKKGSGNDKCKREFDLCEPYGEYNCCDEMTCLDPRLIHPMLPPGASICLRV